MANGVFLLGEALILGGRDSVCMYGYADTLVCEKEEEADEDEDEDEDEDDDADADANPQSLYLRSNNR